MPSHVLDYSCYSVWPVGSLLTCPVGQAVRGGVGEKSLRNVLELAGRVADRAAPQDRDAIHKLAGDVGAMADALCELRQNGQVRREAGGEASGGTPGLP